MIISPFQVLSRHEPARFVEGLQFPGVNPEAADDAMADIIVPDVLIDDMRDLQLPALARPEGRNDAKRLLVKHVHSDDRQAGDRGFHLLMGSDDLPIPDLRDAEPLRIRDLLQQDPASLPGSGETIDVLPDGFLHHVVAEDDHAFIIADKILCQCQGGRHPSCAILVLVGEAHPEILSAAQQLQEIPDVLAAGDDHDVRDPCLFQRLDGIIYHRLVEDREQVLVGDCSQRTEPGAEAARQDDPFHGDPLCAFMRESPAAAEDRRMPRERAFSTLRPASLGRGAAWGNSALVTGVMSAFGRPKTSAACRANSYREMGEGPATCTVPVCSRSARTAAARSSISAGALIWSGT